MPSNLHLSFLEKKNQIKKFGAKFLQIEIKKLSQINTPRKKDSASLVPISKLCYRMT
jgi:hypothetical protein